MKTSVGLSIGELGKRSGVNIETIRYYEQIGVMPVPARSANGYRRYSASHLKRLGFIRRARGLNFSLEEIRDLLTMVDGHTYTCAAVHTVMSQHLTEIGRKISDLQALAEEMREMAVQCSRETTLACPIIDDLFDTDP